MSLSKLVWRFAAVSLMVGSMMSLPMPPAMAHGTPCTPSESVIEPPPGPGYVKLTSRWECGASHYKYVMRSYAQYRHCDAIGICSSWQNTGNSDTKTKIQTYFIENHISVPCVEQNPASLEWQYRIVIQYAKVYNSSLNLLSDHSRLTAWAGPGVGTLCVPDIV
jgi:hypothetical protein